MVGLLKKYPLLTYVVVTFWAYFTTSAGAASVEIKMLFRSFSNVRPSRERGVGMLARHVRFKQLTSRIMISPPIFSATSKSMRMPPVNAVIVPVHVTPEQMSFLVHESGTTKRQTFLVDGQLGESLGVTSGEIPRTRR